MSTRAAAQIRANLKAAGYNRTKVSVRADNYSMGSSVYVEVKDPTADYEAIQDIALQQESIRRCDFSGEILSGGNTYIHVKHSPEARAALAEPLAERVKAAWEKATDSLVVPVEGTQFFVSRAGPVAMDVNLWDEDTLRASVWNGSGTFLDAAYRLARMIRYDAAQAAKG